MVRMVKWKTHAFIFWLIGLGLIALMCFKLGLTADMTFYVMLATGFFSFFIFGGLAITLVALDGMGEFFGPSKTLAELLEKKVWEPEGGSQGFFKSVHGQRPQT